MKHDFTFYNRRIIVFAEVKGLNAFKKIKFLIDTGASISVIDDGAARNLGFNPKQLEVGDMLMTAGGGTNSKILKLPKLNLFGKEMVSFEVSVFNLPSQITYYVDGIIGMDFLLQFKKITFDFDKKVIETS